MAMTLQPDADTQRLKKPNGTRTVEANRVLSFCTIKSHLECHPNSLESWAFEGALKWISDRIAIYGLMLNFDTLTAHPRAALELAQVRWLAERCKLNGQGHSEVERIRFEYGARFSAMNGS